MSNQLSTAFVNQYHSNIEMLLQQKGGVLKSLVRNESQASEKQFWEQIGSVTAEQVDTRFAPSPQMNTPHDRRMNTLVPFHVGDFIDSFERVQTLIDPSNAYVQNFVRALGREQDRVIYQAMFGSAYTGKTGTTEETFSTTASTSGGQVVTVDFGTADSGLTKAKLIEARRVLKAAHIDLTEEAPQIIVNSDGTSDLLGVTEVVSADYNTVRALVAGEVNTWLGFHFTEWEGYVLEGTNVMQGTSGVASEVVYMYPVFVKSGVLFAQGIGIETEIARRQDRSFNWYAFAKAMFGATRMQANKVAKVERYISG